MATQDLVAIVGVLVKLETWDHKVRLETKDLLVLLDPLELLDNQEPKVLLDQMEILVVQEIQVQRDLLASKVHQVP